MVQLTPLRPQTLDRDNVELHQGVYHSEAGGEGSGLPKRGSRYVTVYPNPDRVKNIEQHQVGKDIRKRLLDQTPRAQRDPN